MIVSWQSFFHQNIFQVNHVSWRTWWSSSSRNPWLRMPSNPWHWYWLPRKQSAWLGLEIKWWKKYIPRMKDWLTGKMSSTPTEPVASGSQGPMKPPTWTTSPASASGLPSNPRKIPRKPPVVETHDCNEVKESNPSPPLTYIPSELKVQPMCFSSNLIQPRDSLTISNIYRDRYCVQSTHKKWRWIQYWIWKYRSRQN